MAAAGALAQQVGTAPACIALGLSRASFYRQLAPVHGPAPARPRPARALTDLERQTILAHLYSDRFQNHSPVEVCATLLDRRVSTTLRQSAKEFSEYSFLKNPMRRVC